MRRITVVLLAAALVGGLTAPAPAQDSIPAGTTITYQNWQRYKKFMSVTFQSMWTSDNPTTKIPATAVVQVGPTRAYNIGHWYWDATERYGKQVQLVKASDGGYTMRGFVAGQPFPNISASDPLAGYKLLYDTYFQYQPAVVVYNRSQVYDIDRYQDVTFLRALIIGYTLMHIVDPGYPMQVPQANGFYLAHTAEQLEPEQIKYLTALNFTWSDPERFPESYVFVPSLRRTLRLSSNSRCAPFQGQDFDNDDQTPVPLPPTWFQAKFLGLHKMLMFIFKNDRASQDASTKRSSYYAPALNLMPKPEVLGPWQMRELYVLQLQRLPQWERGYCHANRISYLDKETASTAGYDTWDQNNKFWRGMVPFPMPLQKPDGGVFMTGQVWAHDNPDFQNNHQSLLLPPAEGADAVWVNQNTPAKFVNYERYATPAGLQQVLQ